MAKLIWCWAINASFAIMVNFKQSESCLKQPRPLLWKQKGREDTSQIEKEKRETTSPRPKAFWQWAEKCNLCVMKGALTILICSTQRYFFPSKTSPWPDQKTEFIYLFISFKTKSAIPEKSLLATFSIQPIRFYLLTRQCRSK